MSSEFDPQRVDHWLLIAAYISFSGWILWQIYLK